MKYDKAPRFPKSGDVLTAVTAHIKGPSKRILVIFYGGGRSIAAACFFNCCFVGFFGPILDDRLKKTFLNSLSCESVCVSVCHFTFCFYSVVDFVFKLPVTVFHLGM